MIGEQIPLPVQLRERASYGNYIAGRNKDAIDALRAANADLFIAGPEGSGKSHLLHAQLRLLSESAYLDCSTLLEHGDALLDGLAAPAWLAVDDLDLLAGQPAAAITLARLLDLRRSNRAITVLAARQAPSHMDKLLPDLRTRLSLCAVYSLHPLDESARLEWLRERARSRGLQLPAHVADYLLRRLPRDPVSLSRAVDELDHAALVAKRSALSVPFVQRVLGLR
jgi:DnaA family protein